MRKLLSILCLMLVTSISYGQSDSTKTCCKKPESKSIDLYVSGGVSTATGDDLSLSTYPWLELGICRKNTMFSLAGGRGNLNFSTKDATENYWFEIKSYAYMPVGNINCYIVGGWGQYFSTTHSFIEYGAGASYSINKLALSVTVSNWDSFTYISPGITYNFSVNK